MPSVWNTYAGFYFLKKPWLINHCFICIISAPPPISQWEKHWTWRRRWHPTPVLLPGKSHGQRSLVGCSPWGRKESDTTERLHFHFSLSCIGEGNGNPLQCSCLENPRDGGAWWAAVCGVAQSRTRLKRLSSSSRNQEPWVLVPVLQITDNIPEGILLCASVS